MDKLFEEFVLEYNSETHNPAKREVDMSDFGDAKYILTDSLVHTISTLNEQKDQFHLYKMVLINFNNYFSFDKMNSDFIQTLNPYLIPYTMENSKSTLLQIVGSLRNLLSEDGFMCVLSTGGVRHYVKLLLDTVFGISHFVNEIHVDTSFVSQDQTERTGSIFVYYNKSQSTINPTYKDKQREPYWHTMHSKGSGKPKNFTFDGITHIIAPPVGSHWKFKQQTIDQMIINGKIKLNSRGSPVYKVEGKPYIVDNLWLDFPVFIKDGSQFLMHPNIMNRLILTFTNPQDNVIWVSHRNNPSMERIQALDRQHTIIIEKSEKDNSQDQNTSIRINDLDEYKLKLKAEVINTPKLRVLEKYGINRYANSDIWCNKLIIGDNLSILNALKSQFNGKIKLIYIDPPYFTGNHELIDIPIGLGQRRINLDPFQAIAYENVWDGINAPYLFSQWFYNRAKLMIELLSDDGFIVVRFDYHFGHYAKIVLDNILGLENFIGEFLVRRMTKTVTEKYLNTQRHLIHQNDSLFIYRKSEKSSYKLNISKSERKNQDPIEKEPTNNVWLDIVGYEKTKKTLYPTENSMELLNRIIEIFSEPNDIVSDFFLGSGTTIAVASKLNRKWIGVDMSNFSIQEVRKRILDLKSRIPFEVISETNFNKSKNINDVNSSIKFDMKIKHSERYVKLTIIDIVLPKILSSVDVSNKSSIQDIDFLDYWAVDWAYEATSEFHGADYTFRKIGSGRKIVDRVKQSMDHVYEVSGKYTIAIMYVDILGNSSIQLIGAEV